MKKTLDELADEKVARLLSVIDMHKIVTVNKLGLIFIGGEKADDIRLSNLRAEAEAITQMEIWTLLNETPKKLAQDTMFVHSESLDDMKKGKSILFLLSQQNNIVDLFKNYVHKK